MKNVKSLEKLLLIFLISLVSFSCNDDDDSTPTPTPDDPLDAQATLLNGTWKVKRF